MLDTARGTPAGGVALEFFAVASATRRLIAARTTNADGRTDEALGTDLDAGVYEIVFATGPYFARRGERTFYDLIAVRFVLEGAVARYHVPLLIAPWGYSTYRGS